MTNPTGVAVEADLGDFDPDDEAPIELTLEQELSRKNLRELQQEAKKRQLSGAGTTTQLIERIVQFEELGGIIPDDAPTELKPGIAPAPAPFDPATAAPGPGNSHLSGTATHTAPADVVPPSSAGPAARQARPSKTGYQELTNAWRSEFPLGPRDTIDDTTHFQFLEDTHNEATQAGYRTKGAPYAGKRVGRSSIEAGGRSIVTVIYEVSVFPAGYIPVVE